VRLGRHTTHRTCCLDGAADSSSDTCRLCCTALRVRPLDMPAGGSSSKSRSFGSLPRSYTYFGLVMWKQCCGVTQTRANVRTPTRQQENATAACNRRTISIQSEDPVPRYAPPLSCLRRDFLVCSNDTGRCCTLHCDSSARI
jgi:hypothetical protein